MSRTAPTTAAPSLSQRLDGIEGLRALLDARDGALAGVPAGAVALIAWWLRERRGTSVLVVTDDIETFYGDALTWDIEGRVELFPAADTPPYDRTPPSEEVTRRRLRTLTALRRGNPHIVVASPQALLRPTLAPDVMQAGVSTLRRGERASRDAFLARLVALGYRRESAVSVPGDFAVRGGIVDVYGLDRTRPWRAEWFGDEIDDLRLFDVDTQESVTKLESVAVWPARELDLRPERVREALAAVDALGAGALRDDVREAWDRDRGHLADGVYDEGVDLFFPYLSGAQPSTLLDHMDGAVVLFAGGRERQRRIAERYADEIGRLRQQEEERGELPAGAATGLLEVGQLFERLASVPAIDLLREPDVTHHVLGRLGWTGVETYAGRFDTFARAANDLQRQGTSVVIIGRQQRRIEELAPEAQLEVRDVDDFDALSTPLEGSTCIATAGELSQGFTTGAAQVTFFTDGEIFGVRKRRGSPLARGARRALSTSPRGSRRAATGRAAREAYVLEYAPGDVVVHRDHGIGRFLEMRSVTDDSGAAHEYMVLEYADSDRLFVPVEHLDRVDRYIGGADSKPTLSRLGSGEWERTKRRVKERTEEVARELLALYSRREAAQGHAYAHESAWMQELEASFPYEETPDQLLVMEEINRDMESSRPMDRVVAGDVGFGKTELAVRAAFKAASEGRQVAVLVPTTVLCQQHYLTFQERLAPFPITVHQLSRFVTDEEATRTLAGLRSGGIDIVIGTHRLLQRDVDFKNLGLVIIDEEQRFGVLQKERFKELRVAVDVLSLSATPIPRTLHMSLAGIRDLSVIQTSPEERQPIKTYVTAREDSLVREVITRELARDGQVFYVHNRVASIDAQAEQLRRLVPEARIEVGHGQMPEQQLAAVMRSFSEGNIDVLACTTIIESGLDIPNANTIVINDAHRLGLAQLYQLRGRVGRAGQRAYAYMLYPPLRSLSERADKRLDVIAELQDLGSGFKLAMRDLEIRGAGNLLGEEQHGEIAAVGLEMYNHLLGQAVTALQGKPVVESPAQVTVSLPLAAFIPPEYVSDETLRLRCYQDLAACAAERDLDQRVKGLVDRFGPMPAPVEALVYSLRVRLLAAAAGALGVESERGLRPAGTAPRALVVRLPLDHGLDLRSVVSQFRGMTATPSQLHIDTSHEWREALLAMLRELGRLVRARQRLTA
ncbi:MAG: transcription-repair coupling factor [Candidatus Dormibacteraeota bacterium]|nr:transcription-repair coupling factor [Candidatus Dormibacteraeota bacterium]